MIQGQQLADRLLHATLVLAVNSEDSVQNMKNFVTIARGILEYSPNRVDFCLNGISRLVVKAPSECRDELWPLVFEIRERSRRSDPEIATKGTDQDDS